MDWAALVPDVIKFSVMLNVFALGMAADVACVGAVLRRPRRLLPSLLALQGVMPVVAVALALALELHPAIRIALVALALSPVPPLLPKNQVKAGGDLGYAVALLVSAGLASIVFIPIALEAVERAFFVPLQMSPLRVASIVLAVVILPLIAGVLARHWAPALASRSARPAALASTGLLAVAALAVLAKAGPDMIALLGNGTMVAFALFVVVGLLVGHLLGGPDPGDRSVLALATASRHPGIALAITTTNFPGQALVLPAVLLYLITSSLLSLPYVMWRKSR